MEGKENIRDGYEFVNRTSDLANFQNFAQTLCLNILTMFSKF
jgi:hypothetical protein